jgi:hypothetical protein
MPRSGVRARGPCAAGVGPAVHVDPQPRLENFAPQARSRIVGAHADQVEELRARGRARSN